MSATPAHITWRNDVSPSEWDTRLAASGGHPLQSALWGDARREMEGIEYHRRAAFSGDELLLMRRFEVRHIRGLGKVAWIPRCTFTGKSLEMVAHAAFIALLRQEGYLLCIEDIYQHQAEFCPAGESLFPKPRTILIDLTVGRDRLLSALDSQWRYGVRAAERAGVLIEQSCSPEDISAFFLLCSQISKAKEFDLPGSEPLISALIHATPTAGVDARLFIARHEGKLAAGAVVIRCGRSLHYFWGASDREFSKQRPGEALQWGVMEWALEQGLRTYDLEGIDPLKNPGVYAFKRKMGGFEMELPGMYAQPLNLRGLLALKLGRMLGRI